MTKKEPLIDFNTFDFIIGIIVIGIIAYLLIDQHYEHQKELIILENKTHQVND
jgi:hypothetical protein